MNDTTGRERTLPPFVLGLVAGAALLLAAGAAAAGSPPDTVGLGRMRAAAADLNRFRVVTDRGQFLVGSFDADGSGVRVQTGERYPALLTTGGPVSEERRIGWARIERVDGMRSHALHDGVVGALVGAAIVFGVAASLDHGHLESIDGFPTLVLAATLVTSTGIGAAHGVSTGWRRLYP